MNTAQKNVLTCEINQDLQKILKTKSIFIADDFLNIKSEKISHIDLMVMKPPFSNADKHILPAYEIAPRGCKIIALCNAETILNTHTSNRKQLKVLLTITAEPLKIWETVLMMQKEAPAYILD